MTIQDEYGALIDEGILFGDLLNKEIHELSDDQVEELFGMLGIFRMFLGLDRRIDDIMETYDKLDAEGKGEKRIPQLAKHLFRNIKNKMKKSPGWEPTDAMIEVMEEGDVDFDTYMEGMMTKADAAEGSSSAAADVKALKAELEKLKAKNAEKVSGLLPDVSLRTVRQPSAVAAMMQHRYGILDED